jgi:hypothetical protein
MYPKGNNSLTLSKCWITAALLGILLSAIILTSCERSPAINLSTDNLTFNATEYKDNPPPQEIQIWTDEGSTLEWRIENDTPWLRVTPDSGISRGEKDAVTVAVDIDKMGHGNYSAVLPVRAERVENSTNITVKLVLDLYVVISTTEPAPQGPAVMLSTGNLSFNAVENGAAPPNREFQVWCKEGSQLEWEFVSDAAWLTLEPARGMSRGEKDSVTVSVNTAGMKAGVYDATVTLYTRGHSAPYAFIEPIIVELKIEP